MAVLTHRYRITPLCSGAVQPHHFLCEYHHAVSTHQDGGDLNKELDEYTALCRDTPSRAVNSRRSPLYPNAFRR